MSEYELRGRSQAGSHAAPTAAHADPKFPLRPPEHQAGDRISSFTREVAAVGIAVEAVSQAHASNDPTRWQEAKQALDRDLATATKSLESVRANATAAPPAGQEELASAEAALAAHQAKVTTLAEAPRGWKAASREAELLAIVSAPNGDGAKDGWERKAAALRCEFDQLSAAECQTLAQRIRKQSPGDPIASALAPGVRVNRSRYDDLLGYLDGARKRAALAASLAPQAPAGRDATTTSANVPPVETAEATGPVAVSEPETIDATVRRALEAVADGNEAELEGAFAALDGSTRRALARRLESYRPGNGDELAARFVRLDRTPRMRVLAALRADKPSSYPFHAQIQAAFGAHDIGEVGSTSSGEAGDQGARAFTRGGEVTFGEAPDLHTAAHEAAHAVVQRAGIGPSGEGSAGDEFERQADAVADRVTRGESAEHLLSAVVQRSSSAATPSNAIQRKDQVLSATQYVGKHADQVIAAIDRRIAETPLDAPHPRLPWSHARDPHTVISKAIRAYVGISPEHLLDSVSRLVRPTNLLALIEEAGTHHTAPGWRPDVGQIVATALDVPIALSLRRMGARLRAQLDVRDDHVRGSDLVASSLLDAVIADALTEPGVLAPAARLAGGSHDTGTVAFAHGARDVNFQWMGDKDPSLWNWIKVSSPKDPTVEDVARTPLVDGETPDGSQDASQIVASPPFFAIPIARASRIRAAVDHAPPEVREQLRGGSTVATSTSPDALAASTQADEAALAQAPHAHAGDPAPGESIDRIRLQLGFLRTMVAPWHLPNALWAADAFVGRRATELSADPKKAARWTPVLAGQERLLHAASSELGKLLVDHGKHATPGAGPVAGVVEAYLHAASVAHLLGQGPEALATARHRWQMLPLALAEEHVRAAAGAVDAQHAEQAQAGQAAVDADDTTLGMERARARAANLRLNAAGTSDVDPDELEELTADADTVATRAHIHTLQAQVLDLEAQAVETGLATKRYEGGLPTVHALGDQLRLQAASWLGQLTAASNVSFGASADGAPLAKRRADRKQRGLETVRREMEAFGKRSEVGAYFEWAKTQVDDQRFKNKVNEFLLQLGIMVVTMQAGTAIVNGARELLEAHLLMSEMRGATVAFKLAETATQAVLAVGGQAATGADVGLRDVAENGLAMLLTEAAMKPFAGLFAGNAALEAEVKTLSRRAMSAGATVGHAAIETGVSIMASHVARAAIHGGELDAAATEEIVTQGLSIAAGRIVGHHMAEMHARIKQAEHEYNSDYLATLRDRARVLSERALANERPTRDEALAMLAEEHRLFLDERAAYGDGPAHAKARAENAATLGATDARFLDVPLQLAGLSPVVDGQVYEGDWATVDRAFKAVADSGLPINPVWHPESNSWHVHLGERVVTVHVRETAKIAEHGKTPTADGHGPPRPIPDGPAVPKRAQDHAEAQAKQSPTTETHGVAPSAAESASASKVPPEPKDGWVRSAEQNEALDAARNGNPTKEQRTHLQDEIRRQVPDVALAEAIHDGHAKSVVSVVFPGGGEYGIKTMNDEVLGMRFNDRLIAERNAAVRAAFESQGLEVVSVDHKTVSLVSDKPAADIGQRLDAALASVDARMPAIIRNHLGIAKDYYRRVVDGFESRPHNEADRDNVDYTGAKKHLAEIAKLEGTMKASDKLGPFKTRVEVGAADLHGTDYSSLLEAEMNASKAAIMARDTADPHAQGRAKVYSQEDFVEFAHDTMKLRDELVAEKAVLPIHGEQLPVMVGGHLDPEVLWGVRKKKLDVLAPGQQKTLDKVARYVMRVNALDYMASFTGAEVSQQGAKVERAREAMAKLGGDKAVSKQAASEVEAILKGSVAQQNAPSEAQFFNAAAGTQGDRIVLNADIKDLGIDLWVDLEQSMEHLDASAAHGRGEETRSSIRNTSASATDRIVVRKQFIQRTYKEFYERMLERARAKAAGRPELLRALEHEQQPLYLQGGDEITLSISPAFRELGMEVDFARWLIENAHARVAVTEARTSRSGTSGSAVEAHKKAMNDADPGHKVLKKYEEVRRVLDKKLKAKALVGEKLSVGSQARNAIERMYTDVDAGGNTVVKSETDIQLIRQYSEEALGKELVAKILDGKEKPDGD